MRAVAVDDRTRQVETLAAQVGAELVERARRRRRPRHHGTHDRFDELVDCIGDAVVDGDHRAEFMVPRLRCRLGVGASSAVERDAECVIDYAALDSALDQNWYELDPDLQAHVRRDTPPQDLAWATTKLQSIGALAGGTIARNAEIVDSNPPQLVRYDRWANEVGAIVHHPAMIESKRALWSTGYVSGFAADERERGRAAPAVVFAGANYLVSQADTGLVCSLGMTQGVAGLVERYAPTDVRARLLPGLRADTFDSGLDGSMFLTEREGGSDLGRTVHCVARDIGDGRALIDGEKWFCSNIDGAVIVLLARPEGAPSGAAGLGLYLVPRDLEDGTRNHYAIRRLKPKLGTRSVPTGEVEFHGAFAYALGAPSADGTAPANAGGLGRMMEMVNSSRFGVAMMGLGIARRCFLETAIWAHQRRAKGRALVDLPLARERLVDLLVELEAAMALGFECAVAGRHDLAAQLRRILVPCAKVRLCRLGVEAASAAIELHGGNGYCEDWGLTRQLRDAQCHPIWEGTEQICTLDVLRAIRREIAHEALFARIDAALDGAAGAPAFTREALKATTALRQELAARVTDLQGWEGDRAEMVAGHLVERLAQLTAAALLLELSVGDCRKGLVAVRYIRRHVASRHMASDNPWHDRIAAGAGRAMLAFESLSERDATAAAA